MSEWPNHHPNHLSGTDSSSVHITSLDEPWKSAAFKVLIAFALIEPLFIFGILLAVGAPVMVIAIVATAGLILPAGIMWLVVNLAWNSAARHYPAQPVLPGAVSKTWQSFAFGSLRRFNNCMTIIADEKHLHIMPMAILRIFGAKTASLPLDRMADLKPAMAGTMIRATLDGRRICGPPWCMSLANPARESSSSATQSRNE